MFSSLVIRFDNRHTLIHYESDRIEQIVYSRAFTDKRQIPAFIRCLQLVQLRNTLCNIPNVMDMYMDICILKVVNKYYMFSWFSWNSGIIMYQILRKHAQVDAYTDPCDQHLQMHIRMSDATIYKQIINFIAKINSRYT